MDLKKLMNHERYQVIAFFACLIFLAWIYGCESSTTHPTDPSRTVTRSQLNAEVDFYLAKAGIAYENLDREDAIRQKLLDAATLAHQGGGINIVGLILANIGILGTGATVDNIRRRKRENK